MKVLILSATHGLVERGVETFTSDLVKHLAPNFIVEVLADKKLLPKRWPVLWRFYIDPNGIAILTFTLRNVSRIFSEKPEIVVPVNGGWQPAIVRLLTWLYGGKMVISGHSGKGWDDRNNLWCFPDVFVALSSQLKEWAKKTNPFIRVEYIPNGVDTTKFTHLGKKKSWGLPRPLIMCAGALTSEKRIELAVKAVAQCRGASLLVAGGGPLKGEIQSMGKGMLGDRFALNKVDYNDMPGVYRSVDLFTLPSPEYRSFEIVITEALACNIPVVVNDDGIRREIVGDAGLFVDPTDTGAYARALEEALKTDWGDRPRKQAEKFSWDKVAKQYAKLFEDLVK